MRKRLYFIIAITILSTTQLQAQDVIIYYDDPVLRVADVPVYLFQRYCPPENKIEIRDTSFTKYLSSKIRSFKDAKGMSCYRDMPTAMIQIVFIETDCTYHVVNMSHSLTSETISNNTSCLIVDGQKKKFDKSFQAVIDQIVNYHIKYPAYNVDNSFFINRLINEKRYNVEPYPPTFP